MSMLLKWIKFSGIYSVLFVFLLDAAGLSYAAMSMDEVKAKFLKETGKEWSEVTTEERTEFMSTIHKRVEIEQREARVEGVAVPYHIREGFERTYKKRWDDATPAEQEKFIGEYKNLKEKWDKEEEARLKKIKLNEEKIRKERLLEARELKRKKAQRKREKQLKARELRRKRKEEKKRLKEARERRTKLLKKLKEMNRRHD